MISRLQGLSKKKEKKTETLFVDREASEIVKEEEKIREINEGMERFYKECQEEKNSEERHDFVNRFNEFMNKCGPMFELDVISTLEGPIAISKRNASCVFLQAIEGMEPDEIEECFLACTKAFGMEMQRQLKKHKEKESAENNHCMH